MSMMDINKMSMLERLQTMEALWDSLVHEESEIESPDWHKEILGERQRKIESGEAEFLSIEEVKAKQNR